MKVFYDSTIFSSQTVGGISRYIVELINHLPPGYEAVTSTLASENAYLRLLSERRKVIQLKHFPDHRKLYNFINRFSDRKIIRKGEFDLMHPSDYSDYFIRDLDKPYVITVHDMQYLEHVRTGYWKKEKGEMYTRCILGANRIIAISQHTRKCLVDSLGVDPGIVDVVYHGFTPFQSDFKEKLPWMPERYILYVGRRPNYKNFSNFFKAFQLLASKDKTLHLVCTDRPFKGEEKEMIASSGLSDRIIRKLVTEKELTSLYHNALAFVFPSKMEGFGLPILEAFAAECPTVLSDASCLPEIADSAAEYFDPDSPESIAESISKVIYDRERRAGLIEAGKKRLNSFSWDKCASETADVYRMAL